mmetsp:Transcript_26626/g.73140  ORF Transcript_26626/g.73140 Transcript_26626/m.73140 type:complete len:377 (-) Transcript_26626:18-1148(-)
MGGPAQRIRRLRAGSVSTPAPRGHRAGSAAPLRLAGPGAGEAPPRPSPRGLCPLRLGRRRPVRDDGPWQAEGPAGRRWVRDLLELQVRVPDGGDPGRQAQDACAARVPHRGEGDIEHVLAVRPGAATAEERGHAEDAHVGDAVLEARHDEHADRDRAAEELALDGLGGGDDQHGDANEDVGTDAPEEDLGGWQPGLRVGDVAIDVPRRCALSGGPTVPACEEQHLRKDGPRKVGNPDDQPVLDHLVPVDPPGQHRQEEQAIPREELGPHAEDEVQAAAEAQAREELAGARRLRRARVEDVDHSVDAEAEEQPSHDSAHCHRRDGQVRLGEARAHHLLEGLSGIPSNGHRGRHDPLPEVCWEGWRPALGHGSREPKP